MSVWLSGCLHSRGHDPTASFANSWLPPVSCFSVNLEPDALNMNPASFGRLILDKTMACEDVRVMLYSLCGRYFVVAGGAGTKGTLNVYIVDASDGVVHAELPTEIPDFLFPASDLAFSAFAERLAIVTRSVSFTCHVSPDGDALSLESLPFNYLMALAWSPVASDVLAIASAAGASLCSLRTGQTLQFTTASAYFSVCFSPDGSELIVGALVESCSLFFFPFCRLLRHLLLIVYLYRPHCFCSSCGTTYVVTSVYVIRRQKQYSFLQVIGAKRH